MGALSRFFEIDIFTLIARAVILLTALPVHEWAHAFAADRMGDPTAKNMGRMTLNPLAHLDPRGALLIMVAGMGFAKPVPVDPRSFKNRKLGEVVVSLAGPFSNLAMAFVCFVLAKAGLYASDLYASPAAQRALDGVLMIVWYLGLINCSLAAFNLIPCPPLDGWHVLAQCLPQRGYRWLLEHQTQFSLVLMFAVIFGLLDIPLGMASGFLTEALMTCTGFVDRLFGA